MALTLLRAACLSAAIVFAMAGTSFSQQAGAFEVIPPARTELEPISLPALEPLEAAVADHIREARANFEKSLAKSSPRDLADAYGTLGRVLHAYEFFDAAEASYRNATQLKRTDAAWLHLRAYLYQQTGRFDEAADLYTAARRGAADDHAATIHLGEVYLSLGRVVEARREFESELERYPVASNAGLGEIALREGRFREAVERFEFVLGRIPQASSIHYSLAMAYRGLGRFDDARSHLQRRGTEGVRVVDPIIDILPTLVRGERAFVIQGRLAYEAGQFQSAADAFRKAVAAAPASVTPRVNLGLALSQLGDAKGAAEQFEAAFRLEPDNLVAHASYGTLLARQGRDREAVEHLSAAFRQAPADAQVSGELIRALLRLSRKDEAIDVLMKVRTIEPDDEGMLVSLSILLADRERFKEAIGFLEDAHRRFPEHTATATTLARLLSSAPDLSLRNGTRAFDLATEVYKREPMPVYGETVALALAELGRCDEAADWMRRAIAEADRLKDSKESARLKNEAARYEKRPCRP